MIGGGICLWGEIMLSFLMRFLCLSTVIAALAPADVSAQTRSTFQKIDGRQICGTGAVLDTPAGSIIARVPHGTRVTISDFGFGPDGISYYRIDQPAPGGGYVATGNAPHFCGFANRRDPEALHYLAPPNTCHLIAASRRSVGEVNDYISAHSEFLPAVSAYRSANGWFAISLGLVSLDDVDPLLANGRGIPADAYCADGSNYVSVLDWQRNSFAEISPADPEQILDEAGLERRNCLLGNGPACGAYADTLKTKSSISKSDRYEMVRFWLLGCMRGDAAACGRGIVMTTRYLDHALLTAWPAGEAQDAGIRDDLLRTACDGGDAKSCSLLAGSEMVHHTDEPPEYLTALASLTAGCALQSNFACRDMFRLLDRRDKALGAPASADDLYFSARLWAAFCTSDPAAVTENSCGSAYRAYAGFLAKVAGDRQQAAIAMQALREGCALWNADACVYLSRQADRLDPDERNRAANRAILACRDHDIADEVCGNLDTVLAAALPAGQRLRDAEFDAFAETCRSRNDTDGVEACRNALVYYARKFSATDLGEVEAMLRSACTADHIAGCTQLAFIYGDTSLTGRDLRIDGTDQPDKRRAALRTGCRPGIVGVASCSTLADDTDDRGPEALDALQVACTTVKANPDGARGNNACFRRGLSALRDQRDYSAARADFEFVCGNEHQSDAPYACKHLALMVRDGLGGDKNPAAAFDLLRRSCFPAGPWLGDGEGCLLYGDSLIANRDRIDYDPSSDTLTLVAGLVPKDDYRTTVIALEASRAYALGCASRWDDACRATDRLIAERLRGAFPRVTTICQIRNRSDKVVSNKTCEVVRYFKASEPFGGERAVVSETIYVWPDGDRTLVTDQGADRRLNGAKAIRYRSDMGMDCLNNPATGNSFCNMP